MDEKMTTELGVLLQGAFIKEYTFETIKYYLTINPEVIICLSIWNDEIDDNIIELNNISSYKNVHIVNQDKSCINGVSNVNFQILSTQKGIKKLKELNCKYILKSRTDHRLNINKLVTLYKNREEKILALEVANIMKSPFHINDFIFLSKTENIKKLFDIPLSKQFTDRYPKDNKMKALLYSLLYMEIANGRYELVAERHIIINYFVKFGYVIPSSDFLKSYYSFVFICEKFYLVKAQNIDYQTLKDYPALRYKDFNFEKYLTLYNNGNSIKIFFCIFYYFVKRKLKKQLLKIQFIIKILNNFKKEVR